MTRSDRMAQGDFMSRKTDRPSQGAAESNRSTRRHLLKGALVVLGASVLVQPNGGVSGLAFADDTLKSTDQTSGTFGWKAGSKPGSKSNAKSAADKSAGKNLKNKSTTSGNLKHGGID
jgi:hypothetical protein